MTETTSNSTAVVTGSSRGLGLAVSLALARAGWDLVMDARAAEALESARAQVDAAGPGTVAAVAGDVTQRARRRRLVQAASRRGAAWTCWSTMPACSDPAPSRRWSTTRWRYWSRSTGSTCWLRWRCCRTCNRCSRSGRVVNMSSDAAVQAYPGWGGYGSSKAALDQLTAVLGAELPSLRIYCLDPGDMNTAMHQAALPGKDISDRPMPATVVPAVLRLVTGDLPSGRYRACDVLAEARA